MAIAVERAEQARGLGSKGGAQESPLFSEIPSQSL